MADTKLSNLTALTSPANGDYLEILDVSDTSMASSGTNKKMTLANLLSGLSIYTAGGTDVAIADGGTGASSAATGLSNLGGAPLASPTFTGTPSLPTGTTGTTQTAGDNSTKLATTAYADTLAWANISSPTFTNFTTGNGSTYCRYVQKGKLVEFIAGFIFGSTSSVGGAITIPLPVTSASAPGGANGIALGPTQMWDNSALTLYEGALTWASTTTCTAKAISYDGSSAGVAYAKRAALSSAIPMTWATSDELHVHGTYEAA